MRHSVEMQEKLGDLQREARRQGVERSSLTPFHGITTLTDSENSESESDPEWTEDMNDLVYRDSEPESDEDIAAWAAADEIEGETFSGNNSSDVDIIEDGCVGEDVDEEVEEAWFVARQNPFIDSAAREDREDMLAQRLVESESEEEAEEEEEEEEAEVAEAADVERVQRQLMPPQRLFADATIYDNELSDYDPSPEASKHSESEAVVNALWPDENSITEVHRGQCDLENVGSAGVAESTSQLLTISAGSSTSVNNEITEAQSGHCERELRANCLDMQNTGDEPPHPLITEMSFVSKQIITFVVKKGVSNYMTVQYKSLIFLDILLYLTVGVNLGSYMRCFLGKDNPNADKWLFPYEYMTDPEKLKCTELPSREHFHNALKDTTATVEEYAQCQALWVKHNCKTMSDYVLAYNASDIVSLPECTKKHAAFFRDLGLDIWKMGISLPSIAMTYMFSTVHRTIKFVLIDKKNETFYWKLRNAMQGGLSIVFRRKMVANSSTIRTGGRLCKRVFAYDSNNMYVGVLQYNMPVQHYCVYSAPEYKKVRSYEYGLLAMEWLECYAHDYSVSVRHKFNSSTEYTVYGYGVDGYVAETNTVLQMHGCLFHGCPDCEIAYQKGLDGSVRTHNPINKKSFVELYQNTLSRDAEIRSAGYQLVTMWECQWKITRKETKYKELIESLFFNKNYHPTGPLTMSWLADAIRDETVFGFAEVTMHCPDDLKEKKSEFQPFFKKVSVSRTEHDIGPHMKAFADQNNLLRQPVKCLLLSYYTTKALLLTPLISWYQKHGMILTDIHTFYSFKPAKCFEKFVNKIVAARRAGDVDESKKIISEMSKCIGNASIGRSLLQKERHRNVHIVNDASATRLVNNIRFEDLQEISENVFEVTTRKKRVTHDIPLLLGISVYSYAKLEILSFVWDCLYTYFSQQDVCLLNHDTDSIWLAASSEQLDDIVIPDKKRAYHENYDKWFPALACSKHKSEYVETKMRNGIWDMQSRACCVQNNKYHQRTPLLFKTEFCGSYLIALNSKTYRSGVADDSIVKFSSKGISKKHSKLTKDHFFTVLDTKKPENGTNISFITKDSNIFTYTQSRVGLSYLYYKRIVSADGSTTYPTKL